MQALACSWHDVVCILCHALHDGIACAAMYADDADEAFVQQHMQLLAPTLQLASAEGNTTNAMQPHPNS